MIVVCWWLELLDSLHSFAGNLEHIVAVVSSESAEGVGAECTAIAVGEGEEARSMYSDNCSWRSGSSFGLRIG